MGMDGFIENYGSLSVMEDCRVLGSWWSLGKKRLQRWMHEGYDNYDGVEEKRTYT